MTLVLLLCAAVLTNNIALTYFLGMCPFMTISKKIDVAWGMGLAVTFVMTITVLVNKAILDYILIPNGLDFLQFLVFIITIAFVVQLLEIVIDRYFPVLYHSFGIFLPLITVNCAILGISIFMVLKDYTMGESLIYGFGSGVGWTLAIITMGGLRRKLVFSKPLKGLEDAGITAILAGIMALAFIGFTGVINI